MKSSKSFSHAPSKEQFQPWFSRQHWIFSTSPWGDGQLQQSPEECQGSFLLTDFFSYVSRSQSLKPLQGAQWTTKHQCLEGEPFVFQLAAENSVGAVRRTCPVSALLKAFLVPWRWCKLAVFSLHRSCCGPWHSTRPEIFASLAFTLFSPRSTMHGLT